MGFADVWNRTLVYFGIAEEDDWDEEGYVTDEDLQRTYAERPNVRRLAPRRREREFDDWTDPEPEGDRTAVLRPPRARDPGHPQSPKLRPGSVEAVDRLRERSHLRARRRHATCRRQGLSADAAKRRGIRRAAGATARARRLLQPGLMY